MQENSMFESQHFGSSIEEIVGVSGSFPSMSPWEGLFNDFPSIWELDATETVKKKFKNEMRIENFEVEGLIGNEWGFLSQKDTPEEGINLGSGVVEDLFNQDEDNYFEDKNKSKIIRLENKLEEKAIIDEDQETGASVVKAKKVPSKNCPASRKPKDYIDKRFSKKNNKGNFYTWFRLEIWIFYYSCNLKEKFLK